MITKELIDYIEKQLNKNNSKEMISSVLLEAGWHSDDIEEGFAEINKKPDKVVEKLEYNVDPYRELLGENESGSQERIQEPDKKNEDNEFNGNLDKEEDKKEDKIWLPNAMKPKEEEPKLKPVSTNVEVFQKELNKPKEFKKINEIKKTNSVKPIIEDIKTEKGENIPTLIPKDKRERVVPNHPIDRNVKNDDLPKRAMISSYSQDYISANNLKKEVTKRKKNTFNKWLIPLIIILVLGSLGLAIVKVSKINLTKKNPKTLLLESATKLASLNSYKVETNASVTLPSFANITTSLMNGEPVNSNDKDYFSFASVGQVNNPHQDTRLSNYDITLRSSMLKDEIKTNIKENNTTSFIDIPDLSSIFNDSSSLAGVISIQKDRASTLIDVLPNSNNSENSKMDLVKVVLGNSIGNVIGENSFPLKDLLDNIEMIEKGEQDINGITTINYSVDVDKSTLKDFLNSVSTILLSNVKEENRNTFEGLWGSASINSFEFWIGKEDGNVYQYQFTLSIPLSKIIGLEDKSIANEVVQLNWETTYSDFGIPNIISIPEESMNLDDFTKKVQDFNIKNTLTSFTALAQNMKNAVGSYGSKSNSKGSCTEPTSGSLFSPSGHKEVASTAVGEIASAINTIVDQEYGSPVCYSTTKSWAIASPLASDPSTYYCVDSKGNSMTLSGALKKTVCK